MILDNPSVGLIPTSPVNKTIFISGRHEQNREVEPLLLKELPTSLDISRNDSTLEMLGFTRGVLTHLNPSRWRNEYLQPFLDSSQKGLPNLISQLDKLKAVVEILQTHNISDQRLDFFSSQAIDERNHRQTFLDQISDFSRQPGEEIFTEIRKVLLGLTNNAQNKPYSLYSFKPLDSQIRLMLDPDKKKAVVAFETKEGIFTLEDLLEFLFVEKDKKEGKLTAAFLSRAALELYFLNKRCVHEILADKVGESIEQFILGIRPGDINPVSEAIYEFSKRRFDQFSPVKALVEDVQSPRQEHIPEVLIDPTAAAFAAQQIINADERRPSNPTIIDSALIDAPLNTELDSKDGTPTDTDTPPLLEGKTKTRKRFRGLPAIPRDFSQALITVVDRNKLHSGLNIHFIKGNVFEQLAGFYLSTITPNGQPEQKEIPQGRLNIGKRHIRADFYIPIQLNLAKVAEIKWRNDSKNFIDAIKRYLEALSKGENTGATGKDHIHIAEDTSLEIIVAEKNPEVEAFVKMINRSENNTDNPTSIPITYQTLEEKIELDKKDKLIPDFIQIELIIQIQKKIKDLVTSCHGKDQSITSEKIKVLNSWETFLYNLRIAKISTIAKFEKLNDVYNTFISKDLQIPTTCIRNSCGSANGVLRNGYFYHDDKDHQLHYKEYERDNTETLQTSFIKEVLIQIYNKENPTNLKSKYDHSIEKWVRENIEKLKNCEELEKLLIELQIIEPAREPVKQADTSLTLDPPNVPIDLDKPTTESRGIDLRTAITANLPFNKRFNESAFKEVCYCFLTEIPSYNTYEPFKIALINELIKLPGMQSSDKENLSDILSTYIIDEFSFHIIKSHEDIQDSTGYKKILLSNDSSLTKKIKEKYPKTDSWSIREQINRLNNTFNLNLEIQLPLWNPEKISEETFCATITQHSIKHLFKTYSEYVQEHKVPPSKKELEIISKISGDEFDTYLNIINKSLYDCSYAPLYLYHGSKTLRNIFQSLKNAAKVPENLDQLATLTSSDKKNLTRLFLDRDNEPIIESMCAFIPELRTLFISLTEEAFHRNLQSQNKTEETYSLIDNLIASSNPTIYEIAALRTSFNYGKKSLKNLISSCLTNALLCDNYNEFVTYVINESKSILCGRASLELILSKPLEDTIREKLIELSIDEINLDIAQAYQRILEEKYISINDSTRKVPLHLLIDHIINTHDISYDETKIRLRQLSNTGFITNTHRTILNPLIDAVSYHCHKRFQEGSPEHKLISSYINLIWLIEAPPTKLELLQAAPELENNFDVILKSVRNRLAELGYSSLRFYSGHRTLRRLYILAKQNKINPPFRDADDGHRLTELLKADGHTKLTEDALKSLLISDSAGIESIMSFDPTWRESD